MAVTVDWNTGSGEDKYHGVYGIYNKFVGHMSMPPAVKYKAKFRIYVECANDTSVNYTKDVDAVIVSSYFKANINPVQAMQVLFFGSEYTGISENTSVKAYSGVRIRVGEVSSTSASLAATFKGYDTDDTFYFYNGFEVGNIGNNYREPYWYNLTPYKLPKVKTDIYLLPDNLELLSMVSYLNVLPEISGGTNLSELITDYYSPIGTIISTTTIDLRGRPDLSGVGYWNININSSPLHDGFTAYAKVYCKYGAEEFDYSEPITMHPITCNPKNDNFRLRWINRYGGEEYENFQLKHNKDIKVKRGKKIQSSGIDYSAASFNEISNINNPNLREFGNTHYTQYKLRTDFLNQNQLDSLEELYFNNSVIMFEGYDETPVIVQDRGYKVLDIKDKLQKVEVTVRIANFEPNHI